MKITDALVSYILKKGIVYEGRNVDVDFEVPIMMTTDEGTKKETKLKINFKSEHVTLKVDKEG
jgi:hypothetical protein